MPYSNNWNNKHPASDNSHDFDTYHKTATILMIKNSFEMWKRFNFCKVTCWSAATGNKHVRLTCVCVLQNITGIYEVHKPQLQLYIYIIYNDILYIIFNTKYTNKANLYLHAIHSI